MSITIVRSAIIDPRDWVITAMLVPGLAFVVVWLVTIPSGAPELALTGTGLGIYLGYLLIGRLAVRCLRLRNAHVEASSEMVCVTPGRRGRTTCRRLGSEVPVHIDFVRHGLANVFIGTPSLLLRLWAWTGAGYTRQIGERDVLVCPVIASVDEFLAAIGRTNDQVKTTFWLGARPEGPTA